MACWPGAATYSSDWIRPGKGKSTRHAVMVAGPERENESEGSFAKGKVRGKMRSRLIGHLNGRFVEGKKRWADRSHLGEEEARPVWFGGVSLEWTK